MSFLRAQSLGAPALPLYRAFDSLAAGMDEMVATAEAWGRSQRNLVRDAEEERRVAMGQERKGLLEICKEALRTQGRLQAQTEFIHEQMDLATMLEAKEEVRFAAKREAALRDLSAFRRMGLEIGVLPDGAVAFTFTLLTEADPERRCGFQVGLGQDQALLVSHVDPPVPYEEALEALRRTDNFPPFVRQMRRLFQQHLLAHPDAMVE